LQERRLVLDVLHQVRLGELELEGRRIDAGAARACATAR
jgi:hypothetical protein